MSENIEKILYINLQRRSDRREEIEDELKSMDLIDRAERFNAISHINGALGCSQSHLQVLKMAKEKNYKNVLILEDDFTFLVSKQVFEEQLTEFFDSQIPYDVCMISHNVLQSEEIRENNLVARILEGQTTSGYIVAQHYYDTLIKLYEDSIPKLEQTGQHWFYAADQAWKPLQKTDKYYYFKLRLGKQRDSWSDIGNSFVKNLHC